LLTFGAGHENEALNRMSLSKIPAGKSKLERTPGQPSDVIPRKSLVNTNILRILTISREAAFTLAELDGLSTPTTISNDKRHQFP
jgi:hypothetical protein